MYHNPHANCRPKVVFALLFAICMSASSNGSFAGTMSAGDSTLLDVRKLQARPLIFPIGRLDPMKLNVRRSTSTEVAIHNSPDPSFLIEPDLSLVWKAAGAHLWRSTASDYFFWAPGFEPDFPDSRPVTQLSVEVPFFDYSRAIHFDIEQQLVGNEYQINAFEVCPSLVTMEFQFPRDLTKEYVTVIEPLSVGRYDVVARLFSIKASPGFDPSAIDFAAFKESPLTYKLPEGATLAITARRCSFAVPEPSAMAIVGCLSVLSLTIFWRPRNGVPEAVGGKPNRH